jgi:hypothetical protein
MTLGTILGASFRVVRRNPRPTLGFALLLEAIVTVGALGVIALVFLLAFSRIANASSSDVPTIEAGTIGLVVIAYLVPVVLTVIASALLQGVISMEVARATLGEKHTLRGLWRRARGRFWALIGWTFAIIGIVIVGILIVALVIGLLVAVAFNAGGVGGVSIGVLLIIGAVLGLAALGLWLWVKLMFVPAALMIERLTLGKAIARSWAISRGYFWRTLGISLLVGVILNFASGVVQIPLQVAVALFTNLVNPENDLTAAITLAAIFGGIGVILTVVVGALSVVVQSASAALLYLDLRIRKEGLDLDLERFVEARQAGDDTVADPYLPSAERGSSTEPAPPTATFA